MEAEEFYSVAADFSDGDSTSIWRCDSYNNHKLFYVAVSNNFGLHLLCYELTSFHLSFR